MPRVLQVVLSLNPGGTERLVVELARRLHAELPTAVCCLDSAGAWAAGLQADGIAVTALGRRPGFRPGLARGVARAARAHGATVVHAHQYSPFVYSALARAFHRGPPVVFTEHGRLSDAGPSAKRRRANRLLRRYAAGVFAVSKDVRAHILAEGFLDARVGVIYNGIDVGPLPDAATRAAARRDLGVSESDIVIGTIARLDPVKDLGALLAAASRLAETSLPCTTVVIGDGDERPNLEAQAATLGITSRVRFLGHREDARRWLAGCDVYANSSASEGVSLTILEAMAAGLPIVATAVGGTPEVVTEDCGELVPARDPEALADAIYQFGISAGRRNPFGTAARARVEAYFTLDRMVESYRRVYEEVERS
jgi:glycosyltransferase involved in cell wall biosynthesis